MSKRPLVKDRRAAQWAGYAFVALGSLLLYDAYERRGRSRPWASRLAPGP